MDHDQRFKHLIQLFFLEFLQLFFKNWAERLDAAKVEWLDKEVFIDPPEGERRILGTTVSAIRQKTRTRAGAAVIPTPRTRSSYVRTP